MKFKYYALSNLIGFTNLLELLFEILDIQIFIILDNPDLRKTRKISIEEK